MGSIYLVLQTPHACSTATRLAFRTARCFGARNLRLDLSQRSQRKQQWPIASTRHVSETHHVSRVTTSCVSQAEARAKKPELSSLASSLTQSPNSGPPQHDARVLTWRDYDPEGGLPFSDKNTPSTAAEIKDIYGRDLDPEIGDWIIRLVNYRRQSGSLIELGLSFPASTQISSADAEAALAYLRDLDPTFDEQEAGRTWAEEQAQLLEEHYTTRAQKYKLYKEDELEAEPYVDTPGRGNESVLVQIREQGEAEWRAGEERRHELEQSSPLGTESDPAGGAMKAILDDPSQHKAWLRPIERKEWVKAYEEKAQILNDKPIPDVSLSRRLGSSAGVVMIVLSGCYYLSSTSDAAAALENVKASDNMSATTTLGAIGLVMVLATIGYRLPPLWRFFNTYCVTIPASPAPASMLLSTFTHTSASHLAFNGALLAAFGPILHEDLGAKNFLAVFFGTAAVTGFASLAIRILRKQWMVYSFGASSAIYGVLAATCMIRAHSDVSLRGYEIKDAGLLVLGFVTGLELLSARFRLSKVSVDYVGHFAGLASGTVAGLLLRRQVRSDRLDRTIQLEAVVSEVTS